MVTLERLKDLLSYDPESGLFNWKIPMNRGQIKEGDVAGYLHKQTGYVIIGIDGLVYSAHTLAWFYMTGEWVKGLDHINRVKSDNKFDNLRKADASEQIANTSLRRDNTSGVKGVYYDSRRNKFQTEIHFKGKKYYLGAYDTIEEAACVVYDKRTELHGEFFCIGW